MIMRPRLPAPAAMTDMPYGNAQAGNRARWARRLSPPLRLLPRFALSYGMLYYSYKHDDPRLAGDRHFLTRIMQYTWRRSSRWRLRLLPSIVS